MVARLVHEDCNKPTELNRESASGSTFTAVAAISRILRLVVVGHGPLGRGCGMRIWLLNAAKMLVIFSLTLLYPHLYEMPSLRPFYCCVYPSAVE
jgi:hypothetical protein